MGREKKGGPGPAAAGLHAKDRHKRDRKGNIIDWAAPLPPGLVARPALPQLSSKHKVYFELRENDRKKKKLEFKFTERLSPPPGFEFVPAGNPALTTKCKELSREQEAMIFIVTSTTGKISKPLSKELNRKGHHVRQSIVEQARESLGAHREASREADPTVPEPIPQRQEDIDAQADAAIRDLFPRIPNTDRQMVIQHAFNKQAMSNRKNSEPLVGLAADISLSRRVQLAVLAHIRHTHTRYDQLLRETTYVNARKAVEPICLDILVKWRGDEETGRDQLDEILCEVVVISDSDTEDGDGDDDEDDGESSSASSFSGDDAVDENTENRALPSVSAEQPSAVDQGASRPVRARRSTHRSRAHAERNSKIARKDRRAAMKSQKGFSRYQAAHEKAWHEALERRRHNVPETQFSMNVTIMDRPVNSNQPPQQTTGSGFEYLTPRNGDALGEQAHRPGQFYSGWGAPPPRDPVPERERPIQGNPLHPVASPRGYPLGREREPRGRSFSPVAGQRVPLRAEPGREYVRHQTLDLKDHLVRSIEPYSPEGSHFPPRFQTQGEPQPGLDMAIDITVPFPSRQNDDSRYAEVERRPAYHVIREHPDFITLSPRHGTDGRQPVLDRGPPAPNHSSQAYNTPAQGGMSRPLPLGVYQGSWAPQPMVFREEGVSHGDQPAPRTESRSIWIGDNGTVRRSEQRPIYIEDTPPPFADHHRGHAPNQSQRADDDDYVEIVRVTNKFPRRHEAQPMLADPERPVYSPREGRNHDFSQRLEGPGQDYGFQPGPAQPVRIERVVARVEAGDLRHQQYDTMPGMARRPDEQPGSAVQGRQERVVGIEYLPAGSSHEIHYSERPPVVRHQEMESLRYQRPLINYEDIDSSHQRPSGAPAPYSGLENLPPNIQAPPRNDRPVYHERRF